MIGKRRASLARIVSGGKIENVYRLEVMNATESVQNYRITANGLPGLALGSEGMLTVAPTESRGLTVTLQLPYEGAAPGSHAIYFEIEALNTTGHVTEKSVFLVPR